MPCGCDFCVIDIIYGVNMQFVLIVDTQCVYQVDPFLRLVEDLRLQAIDNAVDPCLRAYGSKEDDDLALKSLSNINMNDQSRQIGVSLILDSLELSEVNHLDTLIILVF